MTHLPPRGGTAHLELVMRTIERAFDVEAPATDIERLLVRVAAMSRRSIVVLITDAAHPTTEHRETLRRVCLRHEVLVLGVADADPLRPSPGRTRDIGDGWVIPEWLSGRDDLVAQAAAVREQRAIERDAMLRRLRVHHDVVSGIDDVVLSLATLLDRSRRARR